MRAILLHGTDGSSNSNWLPWLSNQLVQCGWETYVPSLPRSDEPNVVRYNDFLNANLPFSLNEDVVLVGHSSGALAALALLQSNPKAAVRSCYLVGAFKDDLGWPALKGLFETPYDYGALKNQSARFVLFHSDTDPYCPLGHAEFLAEQLSGDLIMQPNQGHFSTETKPPYLEFPDLLKVIVNDSNQ